MVKGVRCTCRLKQCFLKLRIQKDFFCIFEKHWKSERHQKSYQEDVLTPWLNYWKSCFFHKATKIVSFNMQIFSFFKTFHLVVIKKLLTATAIRFASSKNILYLVDKVEPRWLAQILQRGILFCIYGHFLCVLHWKWFFFSSFSFSFL